VVSSARLTPPPTGIAKARDKVRICARPRVVGVVFWDRPHKKVRSRSSSLSPLALVPSADQRHLIVRQDIPERVARKARPWLRCFSRMLLARAPYRHEVAYGLRKSRSTSMRS
jgi:hypothetical protein